VILMFLIVYPIPYPIVGTSAESRSAPALTDEPR